MALALTPFQALCGFLPLPRIADYLVDTPEFAALVPQAIREQFLQVASTEDSADPKVKQALKDVFSAVMTADAALFQPELEKLVARYKSGGAKPSEKDVRELVLRRRAGLEDEDRERRIGFRETRGDDEAGGTAADNNEVVLWREGGRGGHGERAGVVRTHATPAQDGFI